MEDADPSKPDYHALNDFRHAMRRFLRFSAEAAAETGLEPQQHQIMLAIKGIEGREAPTIGALADQLFIRHHSCVGLVDRLIGKGYVERSRDENDRRRVLVSLTPEGEQVLRDLSVHHHAQLGKAGPALVRVLEALLGGHPSEDAARVLEDETTGGTLA